MHRDVFAPLEPGDSPNQSTRLYDVLNHEYLSTLRSSPPIMSAQPAKRRKTSLPAATPVFSRNDQLGLANHASYMSPTRASLSRFNPSLLPNARSASAGPGAAQNVATPNAIMAQPTNMTPDQFVQRGQDAFNYIMGNFNAQMQNTLKTLTNPAVGSPLAQVTTPNMPSIFGNPQPAAQTPLGEETDDQMEAMRAAIRARKLQEQTAQRAASARPASVARATPIDVRRLPPRVLEPLHVPMNEDDDELSMEIGRNDLAVSGAISRAGSVRSPMSAVKPMSQILSQPSNAELPMEIDPAIDETLEIDELSPDASTQAPIQRFQRLTTEDGDGLPETPDAIRRRLEAEDHPRRGVLFSSPSKKKRKSQMTSKKQILPAVAKSRAEPISELIKVAETVPAEIESEPELRVEESTAHPPLPDPSILARREEKSRLEKELQELQKQVTRFEDVAQAYVDDHNETTSPSIADVM